MIKFLLRTFLWWWPKLPAWLRVAISAAVIAGGIVGWISVSEAWPVWILVMLIGGSMMLYGEPSDSEKRGYKF